MARLQAHFREVVPLRGAPRAARDRFADLDRIAAAFSQLDRADRVDERTLSFVLKPQNYGVTTFQGRYRCRYEPVGDDVLTWSTVGEGGNIVSSGKAVFSAARSGCQVDYDSNLAIELEVPSLLTRAINPIFTRSFASETRGYIERMAASLEG